MASPSYALPPSTPPSWFQRKPRPWLFRFAAVLIAVLVSWGIPELVVRWSAAPVLEYNAIWFGSDPNSPRLFMKDADLFWRLRPGVDLALANTRVRTDEDGFRGTARDSRHRTILCLGDSTTFGWRVSEAATFVAGLEQELHVEDAGSEPWQTINAGVPGYTSFQALRSLKELLPRWRPAYVVINVGNNEGWPAKRSDAQLAHDSRGSTALRRLLWKSKFLMWLAERCSPDRETPFIAEELLKAGPRVTRDEFAANLTRMVALCREYGAQVILLEPTVNLLAVPQRGPAWVEKEKLETQWKQAMDALNSGDLDAAAKLAEKILAGDPARYDMQWVLGKVAVLQGKRETGTAALEAALEKEPFPEKAKLSYRQAMADVATKERIPYIDTTQRLAAQAKQMNKPTSDLFIDHCHPTEGGHRVIANALAEIILASERDGKTSAPAH